MLMVFKTSSLQAFDPSLAAKLDDFHLEQRVEVEVKFVSSSSHHFIGLVRV